MYMYDASWFSIKLESLLTYKSLLTSMYVYAYINNNKRINKLARIIHVPYDK